jgi:UDP-N-acetylglucosamine 2-epimerase (non-hydrolysing)
MIETFNLTGNLQEVPETGPIDHGICLLPPLGYNDFLHLWKDAAVVLTDSGGLQEETTCLEIPCITMRENTERPVTVTEGTNEVIGTSPEKIVQYGKKALSGVWKEHKIPYLWDGNASERIVSIINNNI